MRLRHILGLTVLAAGLGLSSIGLCGAHGVSSAVEEVVAGFYTDWTTSLLMIGSAASIAGVMIYDGGRTRVA
jgi:Protein of unknown function (DUF3185)